MKLWVVTLTSRYKSREYVAVWHLATQRDVMVRMEAVSTGKDISSCTPASHFSWYATTSPVCIALLTQTRSEPESNQVFLLKYVSGRVNIHHDRKIILLLLPSLHSTHVCMHAYMHVLHAWMYVCMHACMFVCMHAFMYVWMYLCVYGCRHSRMVTWDF